MEIISADGMENASLMHLKGMLLLGVTLKEENILNEK